jgi:fengycin family lipopeptide synthetase D
MIEMATARTTSYQPDLTLPDLLRRAVDNIPGLCIGYADKEGKISSQSYEELLRRARMIAAGLFNQGIRKGDKIIIATRTNPETIELLWGSFLLGAVPTVLQPPMTFSGYNPAVVKLTNVYRQMQEPLIFVSEEIRDSGELPKEKVVHAGELDCTGTFPTPELKSEDLAFIQFSSGSTGNPKGIMLSHHNLMVNMDAIKIGLDLQPVDPVGNWMPLFHDMGLIGYHLTPLYCTASQFHIETMEFIMNPGLWLNLMSEQRITITGCTNFGLALVLRYFKRKNPAVNWDFSAMKAMLNGAEPISVTTMLDFINTLKPFGFRPEAMMPVYGMAEATLAISFSPLMKPPVIKAFDTEWLDREGRTIETDPGDQSARLLSSVGVALNDVEIRITDEKDRPVKEGTGHIQIRGGAITKGYYNQAEATVAAFCGDWLRTGDIGFFFEERLYISGRYKDIIFKNGRNYFANDLERMAESMKEIAFGKVCFGGITSRETGQDRVIAFIAGLPEGEVDEIFGRLRALLRSNLGITVDELVPIKPSEIPKTSSGKTQRYKLMMRYKSGEFENQKRTGENLSNN